MAKNDKKKVMPEEVEAPVSESVVESEAEVFDGEMAPSAPAEEAEPVVESQPIEMAAVLYKKQNHHLLHHVHMLVPGLNHIPQSVLDEALKHPTNAALVKDGHMVIVGKSSSKKSTTEVAPVAGAEPEKAAD